MNEKNTGSQIIDELNILIQSQANNNPAPEKCTIKKVYDDNYHADIIIDNSTVKYVECIGANIKKGARGVVLFIGGDINNMVVIT